MLSHVQQLQLQQEASCKEKAWRMRGERNARLHIYSPLIMGYICILC